MWADLFCLDHRLIVFLDQAGLFLNLFWPHTLLIAAANLFVHGDIGSLNAAATLPAHRNRGAQSALLAARADAAAKAGCRRLVAEAGTPAEDELNPSLNNLLRCGLRPLYDRQNWIWRAATDGPIRKPSPGAAPPAAGGSPGRR